MFKFLRISLALAICSFYIFSVGFIGKTDLGQAFFISDNDTDTEVSTDIEATDTDSLVDTDTVTTEEELPQGPLLPLLPSIDELEDTKFTPLQMEAILFMIKD